MEILILVLAVVAHIGIGYFTYSHNRRSATNQTFFVFTIVAAVWAVNQSISIHLPTEATTLLAIRLAMLLAALYSYTLFLTVHTFPSQTIQLSRAKFVFLTCLTAVVSVLSMTPLVFSGVEGIGNMAEPTPGPAIALFALTAGFFILGSIYILIARYRKAKGIQRSQLQYLLIGVCGSAFLMFFTNFVMVVLFKNTSLIILGPTYTLFFISTTAYAIIAHQLFNIHVIIKKALVYSGLLIFATVAYSMIIFFFAALSDSQDVFTLRNFLTNFLAAGVIATGVEPLRKWLVKTTDKYLFVGDYNPQTVTAQLAQTLTNVLDLDEALSSMMKAITAALRVNQAATFILRTDKESGTRVHRTQSVGYPAQFKFETQQELIGHFAQTSSGAVMIQELAMKTDAEPADHPRCNALMLEMAKIEAAAAIPIRVGDKLIGILAVGPKLSGDVFTTEDMQFLDVTAKQTAAAIEKSRFYEDDQLKSEFVSIASHELLTPTAAIEGYLSMILDEKMAKVDPKAEEYLRKVQTSAHRLGELVKDLLSVSRIESGKITINKQPIEVSPLIKQVIGEIGIRAHESKIKLTYEKPAKEPAKILADPDRFIQILTNLISNSIKYNKPKGSITVSVEADKKFVTVHVKDTGIGISPAHIEHLFEKFYRVHDDSAAAEKIGTGLGLFITRSIVEMQGGTIKVKSETDKGSDFYFSLPVA
jgi:signal transduction histidine kinase